MSIPCQAEQPVRIAMITAKTGEAGKSNSISFKGARFAVKQLNERGGILGKSVELLEYDNLSSPEGSAIAAAQALRDGAVGVVGCNWSSHSLAMAKVLQQARVPMITHMSTNPAVTRVGDFIFRICYTDKLQGSVLARFARVSLEGSTAIVLVDKNRTYSVGLANTFTEMFEELGGKVVWRDEYDINDVKYEEVLHKAVKYAADILFVPGGYTDVCGFFSAARDMNTTWELLSADGIGSQMYERIGDKASGVYYSSHWNKWADSEQSRAFVSQYEREVGPLNEDTLALVYDSFMVLADAMERAGSTDGGLVRESLASTSGFVGVTGNIRFDENGDPIKPIFLNKLEFGGALYLDMVYP